MDTNVIIKLISDFGLIIIEATTLLTVLRYFASELKKLFGIFTKKKWTYLWKEWNRIRIKKMHIFIVAGWKKPGAIRNTLFRLQVILGFESQQVQIIHMDREDLQEHLSEIIGDLNESSHCIQILYEKLSDRPAGVHDLDLMDIEQEFTFALSDMTDAYNRMKMIAEELFPKGKIKIK